jgi:YVTN family beta-propeller protein
MTRDVARRLVFLLLRASSASAALAVAGGSVASCETGGGGGTDPPTSTFYFPVGLAVSAGGNALYAVNSDFDLQWNGGTLQSYDLYLVRRDTAALVNANLTGKTPSDVASNSNTANPYNIDFVNPPATTNCLTDPNAGILNANGTRVELGQICAPSVQSTKYVRSSTIIGAFATDLQLQTVNGVVGTRLFAPVRGNATLTWADVGKDDASMVPPENVAMPAPFPPFVLSCSGTPTDGPDFPTGNPAVGCSNTTGNTVDPRDTRGATMPGEPFGMAQTEDGSAIAVTHQTSTDASLLLAGSPSTTPNASVSPSMQFVETDVANGGSGIAAVPHDPLSSVPPCPPTAPMLPPGVRCVRPAFLETNHDTAELDLLRYYNDDGSSLNRPFLAKERVFTFNTNLAGTDSRGIAIDSTPRLACQGMHGVDPTVCADTPARVFFANRTPPSLVFGEIGGPSTSGDGSYDPDQFTPGGNVPLLPGPSRVYVAPIVNAQGNYEVRVFVVNFDSSTISIIDPANISNLARVDTIGVGPGPFAMAFDPFDLKAVAMNAHVTNEPATDPRLTPAQNAAAPLLKTYRFAYVASFTQSFVQVIDLDQSQPTFENVVFTLGNPTPPKGS